MHGNNMTRVIRLPRWAKILLFTALFLYAWWLAHPRISGAPDWLEHIGLLRWLRKFDPLDKWVSAMATFAAVFVALFQDRLRTVLFRARLDVRVEPGISIPWGSTPAHHFRLGVTPRTSVAASFVEVLVTELWVGGQRATWWSPIALGWTDSPNEPYRKVLSGNTRRLCDFLMMLQPRADVLGLLASGDITRPIPAGFNPSLQTCVKIMTAVNPNGGLNLLFPGKCILVLELSARNAKPTRRFFEIEFDGQWSTDPNGGVISIREVAASRWTPGPE